jgi:8-oxo-dGTP diphosphatase
MPHIHDCIDFTVEVFIVNKNRVLLRKHDKYKIWLSVGGHIELDEDPIEAAIREVKEEVGLDVKIIGKVPPAEPGYKQLIPPNFMNRHKINACHEHVTMVYFARSNTNKLKLSEIERAKEIRWFTSEEIDNLAFDIKDTVKYYAKAALKELNK